jgi:lipocalin
MFRVALVFFVAFLPLTPAEKGYAGACKDNQYNPVPIDIELYMGKWYEIARSESFFWGRVCSCTTAQYSLRVDGDVNVVNTCRLSIGRWTSSIGRAKQLESGNFSANDSFDRGG